MAGRLTLKVKVSHPPKGGPGQAALRADLKANFKISMFFLCKLLFLIGSMLAFALTVTL